MTPFRWTLRKRVAKAWMRAGTAPRSPHSFFLDERGVTSDLLRRFGRSLSGTRLHDHTPCSHWEPHTVIAVLARERRRARERRGRVGRERRHARRAAAQRG